jgi:hypothetical protein
MNDLNEATDHFSAILFADDTTLVSSLCSFSPLLDKNDNSRTISQNINNELNSIVEWLSLNKLSLNITKTKYMIFHNRQKNIAPHIPNLQMNGHTIERVNEFNFLGITFDKHMSWNSHANKIASKIGKSIGVINRLKRFLPTYILRLLYNSLVLPHLQYGILVWGTHPHKRLIKLQKKAIRIISNSKFNSHTDPLFKYMNLLKLDDISTLHALKFYYNYNQNILPFYFKNLFSTNIHSYSTRSQNTIIQPRILSTNGLKSIRHYVPTVLKITPSIIKDKIHTHSLPGFINYFKTYTIKNYPDKCSKQSCYICHL